jgi:CRISPR type III-associated protein (TIGR04423 family)
MKINEIKTREYQGYIWLSDQKEPNVYREAQEIDFSNHTENHNPFIIEALLYAKDEQISVTLKHTGKYQIHEIDLKKYLDENLVDVPYLPHRLNEEFKRNPKAFKEIKKVNFKQLWLPESDENCEDMEVLKMKALVFTGFEL